MAAVCSSMTLRGSTVCLKYSKCLIEIARKVHRSVGVLGVPFEKGGHRAGVGLGPDVLRREGIIERMRDVGCVVTDYGNIMYEPKTDAKPVSNMQHLEHIAACQEKVSQQVLEVLQCGEMCLTLGGDHTVSIGTVDAHQRHTDADVALVWVDAHADINTNVTSPSGNVHGMPVALLTEELADYWPYLPGMDWQTPRISIRNIAYIGLRDLDTYERLAIDKFGVTAYGMEEVQRVGMAEVIRMALRRVDPRGSRSLHLSFDIDALDPLEAPCTGTPVRGGLTLREGVQLVEEMYRTGRLGAMDLVEFNPAQCNSERDIKFTAQAGIELCRAACGYVRSGMLPPDEDLPMPPPDAKFPPAREQLLKELEGDKLKKEKDK